jgi:hypothetical protein
LIANVTSEERAVSKVLKIFICLPAVLFVFMGLRWIINPAAAAQAQSMPLLDGMALSSQIGDLGGLFLGMGVMILFGLISENKTWFQAPILLLVSIAVIRVISWLFHDAGLAIPMILVELLFSGLLFVACKKMDAKKT